jgi:hypothetical protein
MSCIMTEAMSVTYSLAPVLGACGRVCNATSTCTFSAPHNYVCSGGDAAVPQAIFNQSVCLRLMHDGWSVLSDGEQILQRDVRCCQPDLQ